MCYKVLALDRRRQRNPGRRLATFALLIGASFLLAACADTLPQSSLNPAGEPAGKVDSLFKLVFWLAVGVFVLVEGALVYALVRFRRRRGQDENPVQVHGNTRLELIWTIIPAVLLLGVAVPTVATIFDLARRPAGDVLDIEVTAHQWWWEVRYPDLGVVTANEIHVPTGRPVFLELRSKDVLHSFWVPRLAGKQDIVPRRTNTMYFEAAEPGLYPGQCAEFCGLSHANMRFKVVAESEAEFDRWAEDQSADAAPPAEGTPAAQRIQECFACHTIRGVGQPTEGVVLIGPDLTHFGSRRTFAGSIFDNTPGALRRWLRNPPRMKIGSRMSDYKLTEEQIESLVAYLRSLR